MNVSRSTLAKLLVGTGLALSLAQPAPADEVARPVQGAQDSETGAGTVPVPFEAEPDPNASPTPSPAPSPSATASPVPPPAPSCPKGGDNCPACGRG